MNFSDIVTFTRASAAWERRSDGKYYQVSNNVARQADYWWNGSALEKAGLLIEGARTNLLTYSHDLNNAAWTKQGSPTRAAATSIFDGKTANKYTDVSGGSNAIQDLTTFSGSAETLCAILENVDATISTIALYNATDSAYVCRASLTWATGATTIVTGSGTATAIKLSNTGPNGGAVYLLAITATGTAGKSRRIYVFPSGYTGNNGLSGIVHHAQLEVASFPSSPILTDAAAVTRAADVATVSTAGWFADGQAGTLYVEALIPDPSYATSRYAAILWDDINDNNSFSIRRSLTHGRAGGLVYDESQQASIVSADAKPSGFKAALAWATNDVAFYADGTQAGTDTSASITSGIVKLSLGTDYGGNTPLYGHIRNLRYWPRRLANAELAALTE